MNSSVAWQVLNAALGAIKGEDGELKNRLEERILPLFGLQMNLLEQWIEKEKSQSASAERVHPVLKVWFQEKMLNKNLSSVEGEEVQTKVLGSENSKKPPTKRRL